MLGPACVLGNANCRLVAVVLLAAAAAVVKAVLGSRAVGCDAAVAAAAACSE